ncbi:MAG: hypothetical protein H6510_16235 [Acidobacteria bacterium]|nr:hypothetical protein [Acidobacteriota bacterium]
MLQILITSLCLTLQAGDFHGELLNGTKPGAGKADVVSLILLDQTMQPVASLSDVEGAFTLTYPDFQPGQQLMVQAIKGGVRYSKTITDPNQAVQITVYDNAKQLDIQTQMNTVVLYATGNILQVGRFYNLLNLSNPPRSFVPDGPSAEFPLIEGYQTAELSTRFERSPDLRQSPDISDGVMKLRYPLKPGNTQATVSTSHAYSEMGVPLSIPLPENTPDIRLMVAPATLELEGPGITLIEKIEGENLAYWAWSGPGNLLSLNLKGASLKKELTSQSGQSRGEIQSQRSPDPLNEHRMTLIFILLGAILVFAVLGLVIRPSHSKPGGSQS